MIRPKLLSYLVTFACLLFAARAHASADGYVCSVGFSPQNTNLGYYGNIYVSIYSEPGCQGLWRGAGFLCSTGATSASCAPTHLYREQALLHLLVALQNAAATGEHVVLQADSLLRFMIVYFY